MCRSISKIVLVVVNVVFALFSLITLGVGIWVAINRGHAISRMETAPQDSELKILSNRLQLMTAAIVIIAVSAFCLLLTISGCVGAIKENTCMLTFYCVAMAILLLAQLVAIGLAVAFKGRLQSDFSKALIKVDKTMFLPYNQLRNSTSKPTQSDVASRIFNSIHVSLSCCGVNNYTDITVDSNWTKANPTFENKPMQVPASCCKLTDEGKKYLAENEDWSGFKKYLVNGSHCPTKAADFHEQGCLPKILDSMQGHVTALIVTVAIYVAFNVVCIVMAYCLIRRYKNGQQQHSF